MFLLLEALLVILFSGAACVGIASALSLPRAAGRLPLAVLTCVVCLVAIAARSTPAGGLAPVAWAYLWHLLLSLAELVLLLGTWPVAVDAARRARVAGRA